MGKRIVQLSERDQRNFMNTAWNESKRSSCLKKQVGAVLIDTSDMSIIGRGFGGADEPCDSCYRKNVMFSQDGCWSMHSEPRAIFDAINKNMYVPNFFQAHPHRFMMLVTHGPCDQCIKYMHHFRIDTVIFDEGYHNDYTKWLPKGVSIYKIGEHDEFII